MTINIPSLSSSHKITSDITQSSFKIIGLYMNGLDLDLVSDNARCIKVSNLNL